MTHFEDRLARGARQHGEKWDPSELMARPDLIHWFNRDCRVRVVTTLDGETYARTGRVSSTGGWRPSFLLMHRAGTIGSSDVLGERDEVTHFQAGRNYVPVTNDSSAPRKPVTA